MVRIALSPSMPLLLAVCGEIFCRGADTGKKLPFVNSKGVAAAGSVAMNFPEFDNRKF
jgi:hypothetical protein